MSSIVYITDHVDIKPIGTEIADWQMQRIAQRNGLESHAQRGEKQDMGGLTVTLADLREMPEGGWGAAIPQMQALAAEAGVTVQHPGDKQANKQPGEWSPSSYFTYPPSGTVVLPPIHLGKDAEGQRRKEALERLAAQAGHFWGGKPSVGRWLVALADAAVADGV